MFTGVVSPTKKISQFEGNCFQEIEMEMNFANDDDSMVQVTVKTSKPRSLWCSDVFLYANTEMYWVNDIFTHGHHSFRLSVPNKDSLEDLKVHGMETYLFCEPLKDEMLSVITTLKAFIGGLGKNGKIPLFEPGVPEYMLEANKEFLKWGINWDMQKRNIQKVTIDPSLISSGDWLPISRFDGLDPLIMYGTGSHVGHSVMALWFENFGKRELYIVESQSGWYWPTNRIQRTRWENWIQYAEDADFHVTHMPLSPEQRAKFNETAAREFFFKTQGLPYGYHNFLYGWVDTPEDNWPLMLPKDLVPVAFSILEHITKNTTDIFFSASLNKKLGTQGLNISGIAAASGEKGLKIADVMAMVEEDGMKYTGFWHDGEAMVCSAYVAALWKAGGVFGDKEVNAVEFTPKDLYQLKIFDENFKRPE